MRLPLALKVALRATTIPTGAFSKPAYTVRQFATAVASNAGGGNGGEGKGRKGKGKERGEATSAATGDTAGHGAAGDAASSSGGDYAGAGPAEPPFEDQTRQVCDMLAYLPIFRTRYSFPFTEGTLRNRGGVALHILTYFLPARVRIYYANVGASRHLATEHVRTVS